MRSITVRTMPVVALCLVGTSSIAFADTSERQGSSPLDRVQSRASTPKMIQTVSTGFIMRSSQSPVSVRGGNSYSRHVMGSNPSSPSSSTAADVAAVNLNLCRPLTGPV